MKILSEILSPNICVICQRPCVEIPDHPCLCRRCLQTLPWRADRSRIEIGDITANRPDFYRNNKKADIFAACDYEGRLRRCLIDLKFYGRTGMARPLAAILARAIRCLRIDPDAIAAVPLHSTRLKERGYNQAGLLAAYCADLITRPDISELMLRVKNTERQSEQADRFARMDNLQGAFSLDLTKTRQLENLLLHRHILLIDDVLTTGATMMEAARPLLEQGAVVSCIAVASDHP
ncbi:MAG: ComF family protein [Clostridiaceae bacterium]|nr:ComF family protein [Clostridiaceae bacterium]